MTAQIRSWLRQCLHWLLSWKAITAFIISDKGRCQLSPSPPCLNHSPLSWCVAATGWGMKGLLCEPMLLSTSPSWIDMDNATVRLLAGFKHFTAAGCSEWGVMDNGVVHGKGVSLALKHFEVRVASVCCTEHLHCTNYLTSFGNKTRWRAKN